MTTSILLCEQTVGKVVLTLNRPEKRNALSQELLQSLLDELTRLAAEESARVIVLAGAGPVFSAGHDLGEMQGRAEQEYRDLFQLCSQVMLQIRRMPQPVIARVHGMATAAGCQLVAACDLAVAAEQARFATPGVKIGLFCTTPMVPLVRAVPAKMAMEMLLTGQPISAQRACEIGLVNRVVPSDELDGVIAEFCQSICNASPLTIRLGKEAFYRQLPLAEEVAYRDAVCVMTDNILKQDAREGISAFLEKRPPQWTGQ